MSKLEKKRIEARVSYISRYDLEGPIDKVVEHILATQKLYPNSKLRHSYVDQYDDDPELCIFVEREETDEELKVRQIHEDDREARERVQYEQLRAKYGDQSK